MLKQFLAGAVAFASVVLLGRLVTGVDLDLATMGITIIACATAAAARAAFTTTSRM